MKSCSLVLCLLVILAPGAAAFGDEPVDVTVTAGYDTVPGGCRYWFTVYNNTLGAQNAYVCNLYVRLGPASHILSPSGWPYYANYPTFVMWYIGQGTVDWWMGIPPGRNLSGFEFTAPSLPPSIEYMGSASVAAGDYGYRGSMVPQPIPEPSPLFALAGGLGALGLSRLGRRLLRRGG